VFVRKAHAGERQKIACVRPIQALIPRSRGSEYGRKLLRLDRAGEVLAHPQSLWQTISGAIPATQSVRGEHHLALRATEGGENQQSPDTIRPQDAI
jgi:hypothetical protein